MSLWKLNTDGMTQSQVAYVERLEDTIRIDKKNESHYLKRSLEAWEREEAMKKEIEELKNALGEYATECRHAQRRIDKQNKKIERLENYANQFVED
tara:strand:+ start:82 stop:369 length:288 start_codon:yes stop_codon:yes gene_type:complete